MYVAECEIPFLFKDTTAFLNFVEANKFVNDNTILVTMDVVSLYTNIPHDEAVQMVCSHYEKTLHKWKDYNTGVYPIDTDSLRKLLYLMLSNCTFEFNNTYYRQNYGTPMGAPASVRIANIFMYKFLESFTNTCEVLVPEHIGRLIDDLFFIWKHDLDKLLEFFHNINQFHPTIKFEINYSTKSVNFLDTTTYIDNNIIRTKLFTKPTDKKQYLHYTSNHPMHVKKSIPFSQALRYRRIIEDDNLLSLELNKLKDKFIIRGYPKTHINNQINKALIIPRQDTLQYKNKTNTLDNFLKFTNNTPFLPLIITYRQQYIGNNNNIYTTLNDLWATFLGINHDINNCFNTVTPKIVFKRGHSFSNIFISAKIHAIHNDNSTLANNTIQILAELASEGNIDFTVSKCNKITCKLCEILDVSNQFHSTTTNKVYNISNNFNCNSSGLIYLITCSKCKIQYVGETKRTLRERFNNHRSDIRLKKQTTIGIHFNNILHNYTNLHVIPIESITDNAYRKNREIHWIKELNTGYPRGLNFYHLRKE